MVKRNTSRSAELPPRRQYKPQVRPASIESLPFMRCTKRSDPWANPYEWNVAPASYGRACDLGMEYAAHFIQFLKDEPSGGQLCNTLGYVAQSIDFTDQERKGYWVGFFTHLERYIRQAARDVDPFEHVDRIRAYYKQIEEKEPA